ncbi:MAG: cyclic peptide export ABC transporter [Acidobacteriota bacterium]|nr:cyclic peptide export ABC transporter [Acidobacteriota bacterium]
MLKLVLLIFKHYRNRFILASSVGLISGGTNILMLAILSKTLADYQAGRSATYTLSIFGMIAVASIVTSILASLLNLFVSTRLTYQMQLNMVDQIMGLELQRQEEVGEGRLYATFTQDIRAINAAVLAVPGIFLNTGVTVGGLIYLGLLSPTVLIIFITFLVFCVISFLIPERKQIQLTDKMREAVNRLMVRFGAVNHGNKELKLHYARAEAMFNREMRDSAEELLQTTRRRSILGTIIGSWIRLMYFVFIAILVFVLPAQQQLDVITLVGYALVVMYIQQPVMALIGTRATFRAAGVAFDKTDEIGLELAAGISVNPFEDKEDQLALIAGNEPFRELSLEGVQLTYRPEDEERPFTLGPINLTVKAGEILFIVGGNGSGKTTLAKLITGLYVPQQGHITLNGKVIGEDDRLYYRQYFSAIFNDFYIFEHLLGLEGEGLNERAAGYLEELHLSHKVQIDENGKLSTRNLSTGQRKRLALLTAYLEDRPIYLFDEWAADQDPEFKQVFYYKILADLKSRGKTVLVISHDDRYFETGDRIIKLTEGTLSPYYSELIQPNRG